MKESSCLSSNLLVNTLLLASFPSLSHFSTPSKCFPGITSKINYFHSNPCLRVCYWGTQTKTPTKTVLLITEKCIHSLASIEVLTNNTVNLGLSNTFEDFKCIWSKLRCAICIQNTIDVKDSVKIFFSH